MSAQFLIAITADRRISPPVSGCSPHTVDGTTIRRACQTRRAGTASYRETWDAALSAGVLVVSLVGELVCFTVFVAAWIGGGR